tara:strand:+ start:624 stop:1115 length:492 start_codon:yes stop_codon:yes gene_type:complete
MADKKRTFIEIANEISFTKDSFTLTEQEIDERLGELYWEMARKEDGVHFFYESLNKKIEMAEDYKAKVVDAVKKLKYTRRRIKQLVIDARDTADSVPSYSDFNPIKIVERATLEIIDESKIPKEYFKQVVTEKLDRERILNDMKDGKKIPGCDIIKKPYVRGL